MGSRSMDFVPVVELHSAGDRAFLRSVLDAGNITYYIQGEHVAPYLFHAQPMRLMVRRDQAALVREILKDINLSVVYRYPAGGAHLDG